MLNFLPIEWRVGLAVGGLLAILGGLGGAFAYVHHQAHAEGYRDGYAKASTECAAERKAMEDANRKAISDAQKKLDDAEHQLMLKELQLDDYVKAEDLLADKAPDSGDICLSADRVQRLSAIE